ncbi:MAG TPA: SPOR domain-containing protein [Desulfurivibrionaceae bacterium]|nr:SPOR domain-containing protein [Desulfurivibrionaceae bacterium]
MTNGLKKIAFRFELSWGGMFGLTAVCACIFLWLFLLGVWAGQTVLLPPEGTQSISFARLTSGPDVKTDPAKVTEPAPAAPAADQAAAKPGPAEPSFFSLQVGAFREMESANHAKEEWASRGHKVFIQPAAENSDGLIRVFIGKFEKLSEANALAAKIDQEEGVQAYIALLPASKIHLP